MTSGYCAEHAEDIETQTKLLSLLRDDWKERYDAFAGKRAGRRQERQSTPSNVYPLRQAPPAVRIPEGRRISTQRLSYSAGTSDAVIPAAKTPETPNYFSRVLPPPTVDLTPRTVAPPPPEPIPEPPPRAPRTRKPTPQEVYVRPPPPPGYVPPWGIIGEKK